MWPLASAVSATSSAYRTGAEAMCGILGVVGPVSQQLSREGFAAALDRLAHRGPDAAGIWRSEQTWLGHRRLAIIDLTDDGLQPMLDPESGLVIVFNGEIYNYRELRAELIAAGHRFRSHSDTEVLLRGFLQWGAGVLTRCNGMWAVAIWNPAEQSLFMARDRFGKKPFYYALNGSSLFFASEPKALHRLDPALTEPDPSAVVDLLVNSRLHLGERTFYRRILALPAAHFGHYKPGSNELTLTRYWDYPAVDARRDPGRDGSADSLRRDEAFRALFDDAVRLRLRSDVPLGLTLSGGLDSSAVLAAAHLQGSSTRHNYTSVYGAGRSGELGWAEVAASCADTTVTEVHSTMDTWAATLPSVVAHLDAPGQSPAVLPLWSIMKRAREDRVPVLLEGQGADEILGGYTWYPAAEAIARLRHGQVSGFLSLSRSMTGAFGPRWTLGWLARQAAPGLGRQLTRDRRERLFNPAVITQWRERSPDPTLSCAGLDYEPMYRAMWRDHAIDVLPGLLHYGDSVSMAHGIESRLPFMDHRLVEWVFRERPALLDHGLTKAPLRSFLNATGFKRIAERRDKLGYPVPMVEWFRGEGGQFINEMLATPNAPIWDLLERNRVRSLANHAQQGALASAMHLFKVLTTDCWLRELGNRRVAGSTESMPIAA